MQQMGPGTTTERAENKCSKSKQNLRKKTKQNTSGLRCTFTHQSSTNLSQEPFQLDFSRWMVKGWSVSGSNEDRTTALNAATVLSNPHPPVAAVLFINTSTSNSCSLLCRAKMAMCYLKIYKLTFFPVVVI